MSLPRRRFLHLVSGAVVLPAVSRVAKAQTYPARPITMIVPTTAGGPTDVFGRIIAERMKRLLGQPIIIENISGADGSIAVRRPRVARRLYDRHRFQGYSCAERCFLFASV